MDSVLLMQSRLATSRVVLDSPALDTPLLASLRSRLHDHSEWDIVDDEHRLIAAALSAPTGEAFDA